MSWSSNETIVHMAGRKHSPACRCGRCKYEARIKRARRTGNLLHIGGMRPWRRMGLTMAEWLAGGRYGA